MASAASAAPSSSSSSSRGRRRGRYKGPPPSYPNYPLEAASSSTTIDLKFAELALPTLSRTEIAQYGCQPRGYVYKVSAHGNGLPVLLLSLMCVCAIACM